MQYSADLVFFIVTLPFAFWAAYSDLSTMKIRNKLNIALFAVFVITAPFLLDWGDMAWRLGVAAIALFAGFVLNAMGRLGGGDAKFIAAFIPFVAPGEMSIFFMYLAGCLLAAVVVHWAARQVPAVRALAPDWKSWTARPYFPMGLGLAPAFSLYLAARAFNLSFVPV
ncbi:A24 family peptidase [Oceanibium sediminis]|uniref:A24 family peptidase n=1 Tax=Oceanibium sediminis TaxID=2026339 RepID=UPI000DD3C8D6|nr:prepilin peptidase [Oceanibium sediminis]